MPRMRLVGARIREYSLALVLLVASAGFAYYWLFKTVPPAGYAVTLLGAFSALIIFRPNMSRFEKRTFALLVCVLAGAEIRSIRSNEAQYLRDKVSENANFSAIEGRTRGILKKTEQVASSSQKSLDAITGKDSVPCVIPNSDFFYEHPKGSDESQSENSVRIHIVDMGNNPLTGVEVQITDQVEGWGQEAQSQATIGTLTNAWSREIPGGVHPRGFRGIYSIRTWTQNGVYDEDLLLLKNPNVQPLNTRWIWWYRLFKHTALWDERDKFSKTVSEPVHACATDTWSDGRPFNPLTPLHR